MSCSLRRGPLGVQLAASEKTRLQRLPHHHWEVTVAVQMLWQHSWGYFNASAQDLQELACR